MQQEILNLQMVMEHINAGSFQEYDYNNENFECEWKQITEYWRKSGRNNCSFNYVGKQ